MNQLALVLPLRETRVPDADTQCGILLRHMQEHGSITTGEAFDIYKITCCGQRMTDLRAKYHWPIDSHREKTPGGAVVARYYIKDAA